MINNQNVRKIKTCQHQNNAMQMNPADSSQINRSRSQKNRSDLDIDHEPKERRNPIPGNRVERKRVKRNTALNPRSPQRHARKGRIGSNRTESKPSQAGMAPGRPRRADKIGVKEARWSEPAETRQVVLRGWHHPPPFVQPRE